MNVLQAGGYGLDVPKEYEKLLTLYHSANLIWQATNSAEDIFTPAQYEKLEYARTIIEEVDQWLIGEMIHSNVLRDSMHKESIKHGENKR